MYCCTRQVVAREPAEPWKYKMVGRERMASSTVSMLGWERG